MLLAQAGPPVILEGGYAIIALGAVFSVIVCWTLQAVWRQTFGLVFAWLGSLGVSFRVLGRHVGIHPFGALKGVDRTVQNYLGSAIAASERAMVWALGSLLWAFVDTGFTLAKLTVDTYHGIRGLGHSVTQTVTNTVTTTVVRPVKHTVTKLDTRATAAIRTLNHDVTRLSQIAVAIPGQIDLVNDKLQRLLRQGGTLRARVHEIEKLLTVAGAVGLVALALNRMKLGWLRCPALLRMGRRFGCGGFDFLESLLAASFVPLLLTDACRIMREIETLAVKLQPEFAAFVLGIEGFLCGGPSSLPSAIEPGDLKRVSALPSGL